jgi:hypothetical protein
MDSTPNPPPSDTPDTPLPPVPDTAVKRRPGRMRRWLIRPFVWGVVLLVAVLGAVWLLLQSDLVRGRAADLVIARLSAYLHRDVRVGSIDYTFFPLSFELHDLVIPGPLPDDPPVATVPLVRIQSSWTDLRQKILRLEQVEVVSPHFYFQFNPDGTSNLPQFGSAGSAGPRRFEVLIDRVLVQDGTLQVNHRRLPLALDAKALWARATGAGTAASPDFRLDVLATAQEMVVTLPDAHPYPVTVSARGSFFPRTARLQLHRAHVAGPELRAEADGLLVVRDPQTYALRVEAEGGAALANRLGYLEEPIDGPVRFAGRVDLAGEDLHWSGTASAPRIAFLDRVFQGLAARLDGTTERLLVDVERVGYAGGTVQGSVEVGLRDLEGPGEVPGGGKPVRLDLAFAGLRLAPVIADQELPLQGITGRADGTFRYRFATERPLDGSGSADVRLRAVQNEAGLPLDGSVPLTFDGGTLRTADARITAPGQVLTGAGSYDLNAQRGRFGLRLDSDDLGRLVPVLPFAAPDPDDPDGPSPFVPTAGQGRIDADLAVDLNPKGTAYDARLTLALADVAAPGLAVDGVRGVLRLRPAGLDELDLTAERGAGRLAVRGRIPLSADGVPPERSAPLALDLDLQSWPAASLAGLLPGAPPLTGTVNAEVALGGTFARLNGRARAAVDDLTVQGVELGRAQATVAFNGAEVHLEQGALETPAGTVQLAGRLDREREQLSFSVEAPRLSLAAEPLAPYTLGLTGEVALSAAVDGPLARPEATVRLTADGLERDGRPIGAVGGGGRADVLATWDGAAVKASGSLLGLLTFDGGGRLDRQGAAVTFRVATDDLSGLARLAARRPLPDFAGSFAGEAAARADFAAGTWNAGLTLTELAARFQGREIRSLEPVVVALTPERVEIRSLYLGETGRPGGETELFVNGTVGLGARQALDLRVQSTVAAEWAELVAPQGFEISGGVDLLATIRGTLDDPQLNGQGELRDARLVVPQFPSSFEEIRGTLLFNRDEVVVENLRARLGGGRLLASGRIGLPQEGEALQYRLQVLAQDLSLRYPEGFLIRGGAELALVGSGTGRQIRGTVNLDRAFYLEDVEVGTYQLLRQVLQRERVQVADTDEALAATTLNVLVRGPDALRVRNNIANLRGDIDLAVRGTLAKPVIFGRVEIDRGGTLVYADNEYEVERGLLTFSNPYRIDPVIDLVAHTKVKSFDITLNISGTIDRPNGLNVDFTTDAGLADLEVLALIATGEQLESREGALAPGTGTGGFRAEEFLAGQAASVVSKRVGKLFGFDRFRISPLSAETGRAVSGVGITVGKRLSRNLFVTYTSRPATAEGDLLQAEWQVADNITLIFTAQENNTYAVDVQWERRF